MTLYHHPAIDLLFLLPSASLPSSPPPPPPSHTATVNEDYLDVELNITFTSGQNASGDNEQCFFVPILNDDLLECNETFDVVLVPLSDDDNVVNITDAIFTVTIEEDPNDCKLVLYQCSLQPKMKAYLIGRHFWVGHVSTSKVLAPPQSHIKAKSALKG